MKTLLLNPPSFENFDDGAGSRWPAAREIEAYWYPGRLCYAAGMLAQRFTANCKSLGLVIHDFIGGLPGETRETLRRSIDFAKRLDVDTMHAFPGTEFYEYAKQNALVTIDAMTDETGRQLPNVVYPGNLDSAELMEWVERFYAEYYFRPRVAWRIVRKATLNGPERRRLYKEAREYLALRRQRRRFIRRQRAVQESTRDCFAAGGDSIR